MSVQNGSLKVELLGEFNLKNCLCNKAAMTKTLSIKPFCGKITMPILSSTLDQMRWSREKGSGRKETSMFSRYSTKVCISGEENRDIINRVG